MTINLTHPIVAALIVRPEKFGASGNKEAGDAEVEAFLTNLYGSLAVGVEEAKTLCVEFVKGYTGTFPYVSGLKKFVAANDTVPGYKLKGLLNIIRAEALAQRDGRKLSTSHFNSGPKVDHYDTGFCIDLPEGDYTVAHSGGLIMVHVEKPGPKSKWHDWLFLSGGTDLATYNSTHKLQQPKLGSQKPGETLKLTIPSTVVRDDVENWAKKHVGPATVPAAVTSVPAKKNPTLKPPQSLLETAAESLELSKEPTSLRDKVRARYNMV